MATRPVINRSEATVPAATMPKINFQALEQTNGSCVPSNCDMFNPGNGEQERPVIVREKVKTVA